MKTIALFCIAALGLSACETPTVYGPATSADASGYSEMAIEQGRWRVTFRGGSHADERRVEDLALLRAADLTLARGYDWFRIVDRYGEVGGDGGPTVSLGAGGSDFGRHGAVGLGGAMGFDLGGGSRITRTIEILMGRGPAPREPDVYDARGVRQAIGPRV
jgi:hypothetical protein